ITFYINGVIVNSEITIVDSYVDSSATTSIGGVGSMLFNGSIDEVRIYNRVLNADEIWQHYQSNLKKFNSTHWELYSNQTSLTLGRNYTYQSCASDNDGDLNCTEIRHLNLTPLEPISVSWSSPTNGSRVLLNNVDIEIDSSSAVSVWWFNGSQNITYTGPLTISLPEDNYTFFAYATDSLGSTVESRLDFEVSIPLFYSPALISFEPPTPPRLFDTSATTTSINTTIKETDFPLAQFEFIWNYTNYSLYDNDLFLMYNFDTYQRLADKSLYKRDATCDSANGFCPAWTANGKWGGAYTFDNTGRADFIQTPQITFADNAEWTVAYWFFQTANSTNDMSIGDRSDTVNRFYHMDGTFIRFHSNAGTAVDFNFGENSRGAWHHVVVACHFSDSNNLDFYYDGRYIETESMVDTGFAIDSIGKAYNTQEYNWGGSLDEIRVWNRTLTADEAYQLYSSNLHGFSANDWGFFSNPSNLVSGRNYTYQACAKDSYGIVNCTEIRYLNPPRPGVYWLSPVNGSTNDTTNTILIEVINDSSAVSVWWFNGSQNLTYTGPTTINLPNGLYTLYSYANNSIGAPNQSKVNFEINFTAPDFPPYFLPLTPQTLVYGNSLTYDIDAGDDNGIDCFAVNSSLFSIDCSGILQDINPLAVAEYYLNITVNDTANNLNSTILLVNVTKASTLTNIITNPSSPITYGTSSNFSCLNSAGRLTVLYINGQDEPSEDGQEIIRAAGTYTVNCTSVENENYTSSSEQVNFIITLASPTLTLTLTPSNTETYGTSTTATGLGCPPQLLCELFRDNLLILNPDSGILAVGGYDYVYNTTGNENYTAASDSDTLTINQAAGEIVLLLNDSAANFSVLLNEYVNISAYLSVGAGEFEVFHYNQGYLIYRGTSQSSNLTAYTSPLGARNITAIYSGNENFTSDSETLYVIVNSCESPSFQIVYPQGASQYNYIVTELNYTYSGNFIDSCWYSTNGGATRLPVPCGTNVTGLSANQGNNPWAAGVNNSCGFTTSNFISFLVDTISPNITLTSPADSATLEPSSVLFQFNVSDANSIDNCSLIISGVPVFTENSVPNGAITTIPYTLSTEGSYIWSINCTDNFNNIAESELRTLNINILIIEAGGGGGGGGGSCYARWQCANWTDCKSSVQHRNCTDILYCQDERIENRSCVVQQQIAQPVGLDCEPYSCNSTSKLYCNANGNWTQEYCENCQDDFCNEEFCGNGFCGLREDLFNCYSDCRYQLLWILWLILVLIIIIAITIAKIINKRKMNKYIAALKPFIEKAFSQGIEKTQIRQQLLNKKWPLKVIEQTFKIIEKQTAAKKLALYVQTLKPLIERSLKSGQSKNQIKKELLAKKWPKKLVDKALR
ncbi:MAG: LamG-like jellyroll fold domain-containing protein, partial [archaeon]